MKNSFSIFREKYKYKTLMILCTALIVGASTLTQWSAQTPTEQVRSAESFINSIGVAVHLNYGDTAYSKYEEIVKPRLIELGVHHIRGGVNPKDEKTLGKFRDLGKIGIKSTIVMDPRRISNPSQAVQMAKELEGSIEAVEGPNEWDINPELQYKGFHFPEGVRLFQEELYAQMKADTATVHLDVLSPSLGRPQRASQLARVACDVGNMHSYAGGKKPSQKLDEKWIQSAKIVCSRKLIVASECGYHNALNKPLNGHQPGVSELASAKYMTRLFFEYFNRGVQRAYSYELIDLKPNDKKDKPNFNYGLLRVNGQPKSDFIAIRNLIRVLRNPEQENSEAVVSKALKYNLIGDLKNIHHTLLHGGKGIYNLVLWQEVNSFDLQKNKDLNVPSQTIQVAFEQEIKQALTYLPIYSEVKKDSFFQVKKIELNVPDHPIIVQLLIEE